MKIFYYGNPKMNYETDTLYDGLCRVLGYKNIFEYPEKPNYHAMVVDKKFLNYPCVFDYPIVTTDQEKLNMLKHNKFDCIIVGCKVDIPGAEHWGMEGPIYDLLKEKSKKTPTFLLDQWDRAFIDGSFYNVKAYKDLHCRRYFKRECFPGAAGVVPLPFSYSEKYIPDQESIMGERTIPIFWSGNTKAQTRKSYLRLCKDVITSFHCKQEEYKQVLLQTRIGLSIKGNGFDTVRYYEVPAHGALLFSQKLPIVIENNFEEGKTAIFYDSFDEFKEKLKFLLDNPSYGEDIRLRGYEWIKKYHTSEVRAKQLLSSIKEATGL